MSKKSENDTFTDTVNFRALASSIRGASDSVPNNEDLEQLLTKLEDKRLGEWGLQKFRANPDQFRQLLEFHFNQL